MRTHWSPESHYARPPSLARLRSEGRVLDAHEADDESKARLMDQAPRGTTNPRMSAADLQAAARGTHASPESPAFREAFGPGSNGNRPPAWRDTFHSGNPTTPSLHDSSTGAAGPGWRPGSRIEPGREVSGPGVDGLMDWAANGDADKVHAAAGTGATVRTRFGTASSRTAAPSEGGENVMRPLAGDQSTGVKHAAPGDDWQQAIMKKYPAIGVAGSPENLAFVDSYKKAKSLANNGNVDPHAIAAQTMKQSSAPSGMAAAGASIGSAAGAPSPSGMASAGAAAIGAATGAPPATTTSQTPSWAPGEADSSSSPVNPAAAPASFSYHAHNDMNSRGEPVPAPPVDFNPFAEKAVRDQQGRDQQAETDAESRARAVATQQQQRSAIDAVNDQQRLRNPGANINDMHGMIRYNDQKSDQGPGLTQSVASGAATGAMSGNEAPPSAIAAAPGWKPGPAAPPQPTTAAPVSAPAPAPAAAPSGPGWKPGQSPAAATAGNTPTPPAPGAAAPTPKVPNANGGPSAALTPPTTLSGAEAHLPGESGGPSWKPATTAGAQTMSVPGGTIDLNGLDERNERLRKLNYPASPTDQSNQSDEDFVKQAKSTPAPDDGIAGWTPDATARRKRTATTY